MKVFILANGGKNIGMGHIMRTSVLGIELLKKVETLYVISEDSEFELARVKVRELGFNYIEESKLEKYLSLEDILIIDRYDLKESTLSYYKKKVKKLVVFDDNNILDFYDVDYIINQNLHATTLKYNASKSTQLLCGGEFVLLRDEFLEYKSIDIKSKVKNILLTVGGSDNSNITERILGDIKNIDANINVILGPAFIYKEELKVKFEKYKNIIFYENISMPKIMSEVDLAISACGGTVYELSYMGVPTIAICIVDNQENTAKYLKDNDILCVSDEENILESINNMSEEKRKYYSEKMKSIVDGRGKKRIIEVLL